MALGHFESGGAAVERTGELLLGVELALGAQRARHGDHFLQNADLAFGGEVGGLAAVLRVGGERDGA